MNNNVVQLPDSMQTQWRIYESQLRQTMLESGSHIDEVTQVLSKIKPVYLEYAKPNCFTGEPEKVLEEFNGWVQKLTQGLLYELILREIELYRLKT